MLNTSPFSIAATISTRFIVHHGDFVRISFGEAFDQNVINYHTAHCLTLDDTKALISVLQKAVIDMETNQQPPSRQQQRAEERANRKNKR